MRRFPLTCAALGLFGLGAFGPGCGAQARRTPETGDQDLQVRSLEEGAAIALITETLEERDVPVTGAFEVDLGNGHTLDVDLRLGDSRYGIEWVSPQDRADSGEWIPTPAAAGQLQIVSGTGSSEGIQVLILEHSSYSFANERHHVEHGQPAAGDAEGRLRRDVRDFVQYARGRGGL